MANEFDDTLSEITGATAGAAAEIQQAQTQAAPAESNPFEQALAQVTQDDSPSQSLDRDRPEPGRDIER